MVLGRVIAHIHTVEFQKHRRLHAHILLILANKDKLATTKDCDSIISAELPNAQHYPGICTTIERHMMHSPCGLLNLESPCIVDGQCSKHYLKEFHAETQLNEDVYLMYQRYNN